MVQPRLVILGLIVALAGCDDADIKDVGRRGFISAKDLMKAQEASGVLVEIHGVPWEGAKPEELAGTMRMPKGPARQVRFRDVAPGQGLIGGGERLVLHFNPKGAPDSVADCQAKTEMLTTPPDGSGFTVNATLCKGEDWVVRAYMKANVDETDWLGYYLVMEKMLDTMFPAR